jgi:hypothetical protein
MKERRVILEKTKPIILGNHECQDIDNVEEIGLYNAIFLT